MLAGAASLQEKEQKKQPKTGIFTEKSREKGVRSVPSGFPAGMA
jgi:hypothetical protein